MHKYLVLISGAGTNLQAIIDACDEKILNGSVIGVISNRKNAYGLIRAQKHNIPVYYKPYLSKNIDRKSYDIQLAQFINTLDFDLIILGSHQRPEKRSMGRVDYVGITILEKAPCPVMLFPS